MNIIINRRKINMEERQKSLTIYYHCHAGCPQLVTYCDIVDSLEDYKYPVKESPVIVSLNQEIQTNRNNLIKPLLIITDHKINMVLLALKLKSYQIQYLILS